MPARKLKCPSCGDFIYVRTSPIDGAKILVTQRQIPIIQTQYEARHNLETVLYDVAPELDSIRRTMQEVGHREPTEADVRWSFLNRTLHEQISSQSWGLYCSTRLAMGDHLLLLADFAEALSTYLEVCYLDLNGPCNRGQVDDPELRREYPPFEPRRDWIGLALVHRVARLAQFLDLPQSDVESRFRQMGDHLRSALRLPVSVDEAWRVLARELSEQSQVLPKRR